MARRTGRSRLRGQPEVALLDARQDGLDEAGLRQLARSLAARNNASYNSRSYRYPFALAAWHETPVGVDLEQVQDFDPLFASSVCTEAELTRLGGVRDRSAFLTSVWAGKEALSKALGDPLSYLPQRLDSPEVWQSSAAGRWQARRIAAPPGYLGWVCWRAP